MEKHNGVPIQQTQRAALRAALRILKGDKNIERDFRLGLERYPSNIAAIREPDALLNDLIECAKMAAGGGAWSNTLKALDDARERAEWLKRRDRGGK